MNWQGDNIIVYDSIKIKNESKFLNWIAFSKKKFDIELKLSIRCMTMNHWRLTCCCYPSTEPRLKGHQGCQTSNLFNVIYFKPWVTIHLWSNLYWLFLFVKLHLTVFSVHYFYLITKRRRRGELLTDRNTEPYLHKQSRHRNARVCYT